MLVTIRYVQNRSFRPICPYEKLNLWIGPKWCSCKVLILGWKYDDLVLRDPWKHCDLSHLSDDAKIPITWTSWCNTRPTPPSLLLTSIYQPAYPWLPNNSIVLLILTLVCFVCLFDLGPRSQSRELHDAIRNQPFLACCLLLYINQLTPDFLILV